MLLNFRPTKNIFCSLSLSLPSYARGLTSRRFGTCNFVLPLIHKRSGSIRFRSFSSDSEDKNDECNVISTDPETAEWLKRLQTVTECIECYHDTGFRNALDFGQSIKNVETITLSMEKEKLAYRERWAIYRLIHKIEDFARRLIDDNVDDKCHMFYLRHHYEIGILNEVLEESMCNYDRCWLSLIMSSKQPLADKLRDKLEVTGISHQTFAQSMKILCCELSRKRRSFDEYWSIELVDYGPDDIVGVLKSLPISAVDYECIKLLFNLEEPEKWHIKNCDKFPKDKVITKGGELEEKSVVPSATSGSPTDSNEKKDYEFLEFLLFCILLVLILSPSHCRNCHHRCFCYR